MKTNDLLEKAIQVLDFRSGQLFNLKKESELSKEDNLDKRDWLNAAQHAGAEALFFVENSPFVVFARCSASDRIKTFNRLWCLARPRILFLETEGELSILDMAQEPVRLNNSYTQDRLQVLVQINHITQELQTYHRDNIESGKVFELEKRFGSLDNRADKALIRDLKTVRKELLDMKLNSKYAHALIGRSIFIRYLEDRGILDDEYFIRIAGSDSKWLDILTHGTYQDPLDLTDRKAFYPRVLQDKDFTYAFFKKLSDDFNGDMFPDIQDEQNNVTADHLKRVLDLLYGDVGIEKKLFFFSYKFDIVPLDLISAIYEEFYHSSTEDQTQRKVARQDGAFYTSPALAEFVCSRVLTNDVLERTPRVLDPACGSGIFLVEAFRRIVRFNIFKIGGVPSYSELKKILTEQIVGIEINPEAAKITAFSLYLAMLHYIEPRSLLIQIQNGNKLPNLVTLFEKSEGHTGNIYIKNAFEISKNDIGMIDVVVGNPPWGPISKEANIEAKQRQNIMLQWCKDNHFQISDYEQSQAFLWLSTEFLSENGICSLLTSAGVLFKHGSNSLTFRKEWMSKICLNEVYNFSHVRKIYFQGAIAPFLLINFKKANQNGNPVSYWSPKQVLITKSTQAVLLSKYDRAYLVNQDLSNNKLWKINWFGRFADYNFISNFANNKKLDEIVCRNKSGQGYVENPPKFDFPDVSKHRSLKINSFNRYSPLEFSISPRRFYRSGNQLVYNGLRILIKRGISEKDNSNGIIVARFENEDFCFSNSINGIKLFNDSESAYLLIVGILWSSFSRYFYFNTSANWGLWHHELHLDDELLQLPLPREMTGYKADNVCSIVEKLRSYNPQPYDVTNLDGIDQIDIDQQRKQWELELDKAVYHLYGFTESEIELILDFCEVTLPFINNPERSIGVKKAVSNNDCSWVHEYAERFAQRWQPYLNENEVMRADMHIGASGNMLALEFYPADSGDNWNLKPKEDSWGKLMEEIGNNLQIPMGTSQMLLDGIVYSISSNAIIIIKRNEKRFWTRSLAREDAEATLTKSMINTYRAKG
ncbi:MAG TPA: N-6 DNA methylase [Candidatus Cloacimonadota bacterium]|nr:N-6 DNA methylase [Candidatus Cloacimonadota bacterium]HPT71608.1 N-6 DNA methylase [Candidatus Cloacimonadota bacterium]